MIVKVTSKHQVTFPAKVLDALGVKPGDQLEIQPGPDGFIIRPRRITQLSLLRCAAATVHSRSLRPPCLPRAAL